MAYLGKISAVLAANTQDFTRGLREAGQELQRFQKQASGLRLNLESNALDKTLTSLQRFEKTIQEIKKQIAANPDQRGLFPNPEQLQKQFRLFEDIGRPLTALKSQVEGLSKSMQSGLYPELGKIQAQFQSLYRTISSGPQRLAELGKIQKDLSSQLAGTSSVGEASRLKAEIADVAREADGLRRALNLSNQARTVESMTVALQRLGRVAAAAADFGRLTKSLDASGVGASFYQPRAKDALVKTASLRGRAEQLPAQYRGEQFSNLTQLAETNSQEIEAQVAKLLKIESMIARRGEKSNLVAARGMAQENLDRLSTKQEYLNTKLQREIASANIGEVVSQPQQQSAVRLTSQFKSLAASLREAAGTRFDPLIKSVGGIIEQLNRGATTAEKAKAAINSLAAAGKGFSIVSRLEGKADSTFRSQSDIDRESIRRQAALERNVAMASPEVPVAARSRMVGLATTREEAGLERESFNRSVIPRFEGLEAAASKIPSSGIQKELQAIRQLSMAADASLRKAFNAEQPVDSKNSLGEFRGQLASLLPMYDKLEAKIKKFASGDTDALTQRFASLSSTLRGISGTQFEPLISSVDKVVGRLRSGTTSAERAKVAIEKLAAAGRGAQLVGKMEDQSVSSLRSKQSLDREAIRRQGQIERSSAPYEGEVGPLTKRQQKERDSYLASSQIRQDAGLEREDFNRTLLPRFAELQKAAEGTGDTLAIKQAQDMIRIANQLDSALRKAFNAKDPQVAASYLAEYKTQLAGVLPALGEVEKKTRSIAAASADFSNLSKQLRASNTGASFSQPRAKESLQESIALRGRAEQVPARFRGSVFADLASDAEDNARRIELQAARILQIQDRIAAAGSSPPARLISERDQAQQGIDRLTSRQEAINSAYRKEIRSSEIQQIVSPGSDSVVDSLTQRFAALSSTLRGISGTQFEPLIGSVGRVVEQLNRGAISADKAKASIEKLAAASRGTQLVGSMEDKAISSLRTKQSLDRETIRRQGQIERSNAPYSGEMGPLTEKQQRKRDSFIASSQVRQDAGLAREDFNRTMLPRFEKLQKSADDTGDTRAIKQAQDMIRLANQMDSALRKAFSAQDPVIAAQNLAKYQAQLAGILPALERAEQKTKTLADAQKQYGMFVSASGGKGGKLDPVLEGAASDIMTARQFRGQFAEGNLKGRVAVSQEIMRVEGEILRLTKIRQLIEDKPGLSNDKRAKAYERNRKEIEAETQALLKLTAAESGGVFAERRVLAAAERARKNTGSFGVAGSAAAQLAFQQGLFAIDDFSSATGGLEYKLRAVGNNITQLGLLLGQSGVIPGLSATTGLFIGLGAVLGGQLALFLGKTIFNFEQADESLKAMNGALEKSKNLAEQNTKAFKDFADSVKDVGAVGGYAGAAGIQRQIAAMQKSQKEQIESNLSARLPEVADATARKQLLEERLSKARDPGARATLLIDIENARAAEKNAKSAARTLPAFGDVGDAVRRGLGAEGRGIEAAGTQNPRSAAEAKSMLDARMSALKKLQDDTSSFTKIQSDNLYEFMIEFINPMQLRLVQEYRERNKAIADIERLRAKVDAADTQENFNRVNDISGRGLARAQAASSASGRMSSAGVDADIRGEIDRRMTFLASELSSAIQGAGAAAEVGDKDGLANAEKNAAAAMSQLGKSMEQIDRILSGVALGSVIPTSARLESSASRLAGLGPSQADTSVARARLAYDQASRERDQAVVMGDEAGVNAADMRLTVIRNFAASLDKAAYAVESFSRAAANAATELSRTLVQEAKSNADQLRRRANKLSGDPLEGGQSQDDLAEARKQQAQQEQDDRDMRRAVAAERLAFEQEVAAGRDPGGAALLNRIQAGRDAEGNKELTPAQQEARRADAEQAQAELDARIALRPGVVAQAEKVDARDAAVQAKLEAERVRREKISLGMQAADSSADAARRMFTETGDVGNAIEVRGIEDRIRDVRRKVGEAPAGSTVSKELEDELNLLQSEGESFRGIAISGLVRKRRRAGTGLDAQMKAAQRELQGIEISGLQAPMTELEVRRADLERRRDNAITANDPAKAADIQKEIEATDKLANELNAAAIAVSAFQQAANKAAMDLQNSVAREAEGMANEARRTANEAEAVLGARDPKTMEAFKRQARLEAGAKEANKERDSAQAEIDSARLKYENRIRFGADRAAADRAEEIRKNEEIAKDEKKTPDTRQRARNKADRLRREQEAEFEALPEVRAARDRADAADVRLQKARSAERGRDLGKSEMDRRKEEIDRKAGDIGNATDQMKNAGDRAGAEDLARRAAINMARDAAPLYAQLGDELMTARLQGPSRSALNASDIQTSEGAKELNRLLRGEDSAKDVNLAEMQKQSGLLERIEAAIENSTGFNVL